jgi:hypothetical protein
MSRSAYLRKPLLIRPSGEILREATRREVERLMQPQRVFRSANGEPKEMRLAPWRDYHGKPIHEGDTIEHPSGERGVVVFLAEEADPGDAWRVRYSDGPGGLSRLGLQIGNKGRAVVV